MLEEAGFDYVHVLTDEKASKSRIGTLLEAQPFRSLSSLTIAFSSTGPAMAYRRPMPWNTPLGYLPLEGSGRRQFSTMVSMDDLNRCDRRIPDKAFAVTPAFMLQRHRRHARLKVPCVTSRSHALPSQLIISLPLSTGNEETIAGRRWRGSLFTDTFIEAARKRGLRHKTTFQGMVSSISRS